MMLFKITILTIGIGVIAWTFWWSYKERQRKGKEEFLRALSGEKTFADLKAECERKYGIMITAIQGVDGDNVVVDMETINYHVRFNQKQYDDVMNILGQHLR